MTCCQPSAHPKAAARARARVLGLGRWMKFNLVGAMGMAVQFAILSLLAGAIGVQYLLATAVAVECTVLHNFAWHECFTWSDRKPQNRLTKLLRLLHFNATTGMISIGGNLLLMRILVGAAHAPLLLANCASVAACSVANYLVNDRWVFRGTDWCEIRSARGPQLTAPD